MSTSLDLNGKWKKELIELVNTLTTENAILKGLQAYMETSNARLTKLEREQNKHLQYNRRNCIEISGIPSTIDQGNLEEEVIKIYDEAGVKVHNRKLSNFDIQGCHRIGKKE